MAAVERICCVCRVKQPVNNMTRVARVNGNFFVDLTHKMGGRGCHICPNCVQKAVKTKALNRAFKTAVPEDVYNNLPVAK
jgi:predicted RNA-binding protein YlxR (DUF448 family)